MKKEETYRIVLPIKVQRITPTKEEDRNHNSWLKKGKDLGDNPEIQIYNKTIFNLVTHDDYYFKEDEYAQVCFRQINWIDLTSYDFIRYDGNSFKFIYFEDDRDGYPEYGILHIKKEYINKLIETLYNKYDGDSKSLIDIIKYVFDKELPHIYGHLSIMEWLDDNNIDYFKYHLYHLEHGIDL